MLGVLPSVEVYKLIRDGYLLIEPFEFREDETPPASVDLRLAGKVLKYDMNEYILGEEIPEELRKYEKIDNELFELNPGEGAIFQIYERIAMPHFLIGLILPRSSLTRLGVSLVPVYLNPGYQGNCPVLLVNNSPIKIKIPFKDGKSPRLAQALFLALSSKPHRAYGEGVDEKYQDDKAYHARFYKDVDIYEILRPLAEAVRKHGF